MVPLDLCSHPVESVYSFVIIYCLQMRILRRFEFNTPKGTSKFICRAVTQTLSLMVLKHIFCLVKANFFFPTSLLF